MAIQDKMKSVRVPVALKPDPNSITPQVRDEVQTKLNAKPLTIPVEFVFETGAKRVESAAKAASQAAEKSMTFSAELEELKAYREYLNATAIDAATFREKLNSVYENLFPRRNRPSIADNELLPQADKLIAEMEDKAAKLADASAKATARQQLMIGGDAIEAFRVDAQAKLDAMKPLEFTNIKLKASTVDASGIKEAVGLDKLESNAKLLKGIAVPLSKLDVSNAMPVNADILQKNFDALVNLTIPISRLTFSDDVSKMDTTKLKDNVDTLGNKLVLPIYKADLENVRAIQSGEEVSKKISDLAHLVAYIQSIDLGKAKIENEEGLENKVREFANKLKKHFTDMGAELGKEIKIPFLDQKNINRMFAYARAIKTIADSMKYLNRLQETLAKLDVNGQELAKAYTRKLAAEENDPLVLAKSAQIASDVFANMSKKTQDALDKSKDYKEFADKMFGDINQYADRMREKSDVKPPMALNDMEGILKSQKTFNQYLTNTMGMFQNIESVMKSNDRFGAGFMGALTDTHAASQRLARSFDAVKAMADGASSGMSAGLKKAKDELQKLETGLVDSRRKYTELLDAVKKGAFGMAGGGAMNIAGLDVTALKRLQAEMRTTGDSFTEMMRTMGFYITGRSVITFFQNAIKSASQFSMEIRRIQSLATTFDFDRIKTGLESLDARFGNLIHNAKALYWAFSSGVRGTEEELVRFTETMSKTAITIGSDVMPVMDAATTLMNAYGKSAASAGEISDLLFTIVKEGKANGQQLASSIGNIIAPASAMGLTFKDIGATISTLTRTMKTNNALTYLNNILAKMNNPTKEVQSQLDKLGLEINATAIKAKGFAQVMREIHDATRGDINLIAKIFPDIRGQRAAVTLFSTQFGEFQKQLENFGNMSGNMQEALSKITDNPEAQFAALRNGFEMIRQAAGDAAINVITFGGALTPIFSAVNGMKSFGRSVAGHIAGLAALGVVMNMVGKAKLMLESANISSIQQMNLAYVEQTKLIGDSILAQRKQIEQEETLKKDALEKIRTETLANDVRYGEIQRELELLDVREKTLKTQKEETQQKLLAADYDAKALMYAEQIFLARDKNAMAYQKLISAFEAAKSTPIQWATSDNTAIAGAWLRNMRAETSLQTRMLGLKPDEIQKVVEKELMQTAEDDIDKIALLAKAGLDAKNKAHQQILERMLAETKANQILSDVNLNMMKLRKEGSAEGSSPEVVGTLTQKINALYAELVTRFHQAKGAYTELDAAIIKGIQNELEQKVVNDILLKGNDLISQRAALLAEALGIEASVGGGSYKRDADAAKARVQMIKDENAALETNLQNLNKTYTARVKDKAAMQDATGARFAAMEYEKNVKAYLAKNNLRLPGVAQNGALDNSLANVRMAEEQEKAARSAKEIADSAQATALHAKEAAIRERDAADAAQYWASEMAKARDIQASMMATSRGGKGNQAKKLALLEQDAAIASAQAAQAQASANAAASRALASELAMRKSILDATNAQIAADKLRASINNEAILQQYAASRGQYGGARNAWYGASAAARGTDNQFLNTLSRLSFLPGIGGALGLFVRPLAIFGKQIQYVTAMATIGTAALAKHSIAMRWHSAAAVSALANQRKLTAAQSMAAHSASLFAGTILNTPLFNKRGWAKTAKELRLSADGMRNAVWAVSGAFGVATVAVSGLVLLLTSLTENGGPLRRLAEWMVGLDAIKQRGTALDSISGMVRDVATRRNDFEQRRQYLLSELDYRRKTGQVIGETNGVDAIIIRQREQQLRNVKLEKNIESERISQLSSQYAETYAGAESLFNKYDVTYQNGFWRQLWEVSTAIDWRKITFPTEMYRIVSDMVRLRKASRELRGLDIDIDTERFTSQQIVPRAIATLRSHEMLLEMENNTADVMAQEQNNAMRQLALETKRNLTLRRMSILTGGKSPYMKMYEVATAEEVARAKKEEADFRLQKMLENGMSAESDAYKTQSALAEQLGKELERAETAAGNFHTSYVNYRKQQAQQLLEQIKLDREIADMTRKSNYQELDRQAFLGGDYAEAAKLEAQFKDAHKLADEAARRNAAITIDAYKKQYTTISKTLPSMYEDVAEKESARDRAKSALLALERDASDEERSKAIQAYEKARNDATGARNALNQTNAELRNLAALAEKAKKMPLSEKELYEIRQKEMDAAKNLSNFWKKVLDDMTNVVKTSKNAIDVMQVNRIRSVIGGERRLPAMSRRDVSAYRERLFRAQTEDEAREIRMQYRREAILRNPSQGLGSTFAKAGVLKRYVNEAIVRDQREFMQLQQGLAERGGMMGPDERSRTLARMRELQDSITKGMETYIGVQGDLVKRQKEARNGILQLAQSLQKFRSVAVDAVDSLSSEAFSMRFRSFSGLKELPQMRTTTAEERSMYGNMERKDAWGTMANEVMAAFATRYGEDAKRRYEDAIKGLEAPANTFKTAAETFDRAVQRPLTVNVNAVDVFGGRQ